jgi:branched-chain amino acid transport system permease protein
LRRNTICGAQSFSPAAGALVAAGRAVMDAVNLAEDVLQALVTGLLVGCIYALMCTGLGLIFGIMRIINFAQGEFLMIGMYLSLYLSAALSIQTVLGGELGPFAVAILTGPIVFVFGIIVHRLLLAPAGVRRDNRRGRQGHYAQLILTLGLTLILQNGAMLLFGAEPRSVSTPASTHAWEFGLPGIENLTIFVNHARLYSALLSIVIATALFAFVSRTRTGKALRAASDNQVAAGYVGIDVTWVHGIAFGLGCAVTAIAGGCIATYLPMQPYVGIDFIVVMYAGVVLGGLGQLHGAFWGGLVIGVVQQMSSLVLPLQLQNTAVFVVFLGLLLLRPQGLFGRATERT